VLGGEPVETPYGIGTLGKLVTEHEFSSPNT
jgi:hypothetical protein